MVLNYYNDLDDISYFYNLSGCQNITYTDGYKEIVDENCYVTPLANFSATTGYTNFYVYDEKEYLVFKTQLNATQNYSNSHYGNTFICKKYWKYGFLNSNNVSLLQVVISK